MKLEDFAVPEELRYHPEHFWVRTTPKGLEVGWTDFAQATAGDVAFVELVAVGSSVEHDGHFGTLETGKWVGKLVCPVTGKVQAVNGELVREPQQINSDPYGKGWLIRVQPRSPDATAHLMGATAYRDHLRRAIAEME